MESQIQLLTRDISRLRIRIGKTIERFKLMSTLKTDNEFEYKNFLYLNLLEKLSVIIKNIKKDKSNLLLLVSSHRFIFETLINTELIKKEPKHVYTLIYSTYNHQAKKTNVIIENLKKDLIALNQLIEIENELIAFLDNKNNTKKDKLNFKKQSEQKVFDILLDNTHPFLAHVFDIGFANVHEILTNVVVPKYEKLKIDLENEKKLYAKKILTKKYITELFDFKNQISKVFTEFVDSRNWKEKAKEVGLEEDYNIMYDYTSSLIHSTSYSLITTPEIENDEVSNNLIFIRQFLIKILNNIDDYLLTFNSRYLLITSPNMKKNSPALACIKQQRHL